MDWQGRQPGEENTLIVANRFDFKIVFIFRKDFY